MSKCPNPKCRKEIPTFTPEEATIIRDNGTQLAGLIISCPECQTIVGVVNNSFHPISGKKIDTSMNNPSFKKIMKKAAE